MNWRYHQIKNELEKSKLQTIGKYDYCEISSCSSCLKELACTLEDVKKVFLNW